MAIQLPNFDSSGLASLASNRYGNLGLGRSLNLAVAPPDRTLESVGKGLASLVQQRSAKAAEAKADERYDKEFALKEKALNARQSLDERRANMSEQQMAFEKEKYQKGLDAEASKVARANNEEQLAKKAAAGVLISMMPDEILKDKDKKGIVLDSYVEEGVITKEQKDGLMEIEDPDVLRTKSKVWAAVHKKGMDFVKEPSKGQTININTGENRDALTASTKTTVQKDLLDTQKEYERLKNVGDNYFKEALTWQGQGKAKISKWAEKSEGLPLIGPFMEITAEAWTGMNKKERSDYIAAATTFLTETEQFFNKRRHDITGAQAAYQEIQLLKKAFLNGQMAPSEFAAAYKSTMKSFERELYQSKEALKKGVNVDNEMDRVNKIVAPIGYSYEDVVRTAKKYNMTVDDVLKKIGEKK